MGAKVFIFYIIEENVLHDNLIIREQHWLDILKPYKRNIGYNISKIADRLYRPKKKCKIKKCNNYCHCYGYCNKHYLRYKRHKNPLYTNGRLIPIKNRGCSIDGCKNKHDSFGYCSKHAYYIRKYGKIQNPKIIFNSTRGCKIKGCKNKHQAKGYCHKHYETYRYNKYHPIIKKKRKYFN